MAFSDTKQPGDLITASDYNDLVDDLFTRIKGNNINKATADISANLPVPGEGDKIFIETDSGRTLYDNGSEFVEIGLSESEMKLGDVGNLDAGQRKITNLADPTDARDAVNKQFVDRSQAGLEVKESTRVATAGTSIDLTSATDPNPVDGVNLNDGDRVLLKDQTDDTQNGIYDAVNATDPTTWVRSNDFDEDSEAVAGAFVFVEEGGENKNEGYVVKTNDPITLGTTAIEWTQFSGVEVVAGEGIEKSGDKLNIRMPLEDDATQVTTVSAIDFGGNDFVVTDDTDNTATIQLSDDSLSVAGNSVSLGGSTTLDYVDLNDTESSFPIPNTDLDNSSIEIAGTTVSLGGSTTPEVTDLGGSNGTQGQFLQTDGTDLSFKTVSAEQTATTSSNFTTSGQTTVFADVSFNTLTVTLATSDADDGSKVRVVDKSGNAGSNNITVNTEGSQTINGETSAILNNDFEAVTFQSDGSNWFIVSRMSGGGSV